MTDHTPTNPPVCSYEGSDYQESFWDKGERDYEDAAEAIALRRLLSEPGHLLLELGAGAGRNTPRYGMYERVVLLDYSRTQLLQARQRLGADPRYTYVAADAYALPFVPGLFDGATMIRTLHHMAKPDLVFAQIRKVLAQNAVFILEYANKRNLKSILRWLAGKQTWNPFSPEQIEFAALNFDFHPKTLRKLLAEYNFKLDKQLSVSHFRMGWLKRKLPLKLLLSLDSALQWTGAFAQYTPSIFTRSRALAPSPVPAETDFFACPQCGHALPLLPQTQTCQGCAHVWQYQDGIYEFRAKPES